MKLLTEAFIIMTLGMTVTFAFLGIVIGAVSLIARLVRRIEGEPREEAEGPADGGRHGERTRLVAIIAAALHGRLALLRALLLDLLEAADHLRGIDSEHQGRDQRDHDRAAADAAAAHSHGK